MNKAIFFICLSSLFFAGIGSAADANPQPKELTELESKYQSDLQNAVKPVKDHYVDALKSLLQSELNKGDADAIVAVRAELAKAEAASALSSEDSLFSGTKWKSDAGGIVEFGPQGKWTETWKGNSNEGSWKLGKDPTEAIVTRGDNQVFHFQLSAGKTLLRDIDKILYQQASN